MKVYIGRYPGKRSKKKDKTVRVRIDRYDAWNADSTLAYVILPVLKELKKQQHGAPFVDQKDVPAGLRTPKGFDPGPEHKLDRHHFARWNWILNEMIWAFTQINTEWEDKYRKGKMDTKWIPLDAKHNIISKGSKEKPAYWRMTKGPKDTYKVDRKGMNAHLDRIKRGTTFFGKYYQSLWD